MGCSGSKGVDNGSSAYHPQQHQQQQQQQYAVNIPPSTLPQGWISQYDPNKQSLYYVHPQTNNVTWAHPLGPSYHAQETTRFHQIQQLQRQQFSSNQSGFYDSYNRQGGMGAGAGLAMGMMAGGAMGLMAGSMLGGGMHGGYYGGGSDVTPVEHVSGGDYSGSGDYSGGGDFGGGDFGGGDFGGGF